MGSKSGPGEVPGLVLQVIKVAEGYPPVTTSQEDRSVNMHDKDIPVHECMHPIHPSGLPRRGRGPLCCSGPIHTRTSCTRRCFLFPGLPAGDMLTPDMRTCEAATALLCLLPDAGKAVG